jgi:mannose-6-phosphate isomerase-like protein (cupin superfamily)
MAQFDSNHPDSVVDRRSFLQSIPAAAAVLTLADASLFAAPASAQSPAAAGAAAYRLFTAKEIQSDISALQASPGNNNLVQEKTFTAVLTTETAKSAAEFEWHEGRDHIFQILEGSTVYELGGTPKNGRNIRPGEWLAPESEAHEVVALNKGDMIVIQRGTPHRRRTAGTVTFLLISPQGTAA